MKFGNVDVTTEAQALAAYLRGRKMSRTEQMVTLASCAATLVRMDSVDQADAESYLGELIGIMRETAGVPPEQD